MELECCELTHHYDYENAGEYSPGCIDCGRCDCFGDGFRIEKCTVVAKITSTVCEKCADTKEHIKKYFEKSAELDTHRYVVLLTNTEECHCCFGETSDLHVASWGCWCLL